MDGKFSLDAAVRKAHENWEVLIFGRDLRVGLDAPAGEVGLPGRGDGRNDVEKAVCAGGNTQLWQPVDITTACLR